MSHTQALYPWADRVQHLFPDLLPHHGRTLAWYSFGAAVARTCGLTQVVAYLAGFLALMIVVQRRVIPSVLHHVVRSGSRELLPLAVLAIALCIAFGAAELLGVARELLQRKPVQRQIAIHRVDHPIAPAISFGPRQFHSYRVVAQAAQGIAARRSRSDRAAHGDDFGQGRLPRSCRVPAF